MARNRMHRARETGAGGKVLVAAVVGVARGRLESEPTDPPTAWAFHIRNDHPNDQMSGRLRVLCADLGTGNGGDSAGVGALLFPLAG